MKTIVRAPLDVIFPNLPQHISGEAERVKIQRICDGSVIKRPRLESSHCEKTIRAPLDLSFRNLLQQLSGEPECMKMQEKSKCSNVGCRVLAAGSWLLAAGWLAGWLELGTLFLRFWALGLIHTEDR